MAEAFSYKITTESELFTFDFTQVLSPSETILTAVCTAIVMNGTDANPSNIIVGGTVIVNQTASQRIANGVSDVTYRLQMTITTSQGNTYVGVGDLSIYDSTLV
jgi:hydrogenase maturation factor HypF (carbamoyltransferase family)